MSVSKFNYFRYNIGFWPSFPLNPVQEKAQKLINNKLKSGYYKTETTACPLCKSVHSLDVSKMDMYGFATRIALCKDCGLLYTRDRLSYETIPLFYNEHYRQLDRGTAFPNDAYFNLQKQKGLVIENLLQEAGVELRPQAIIAEIGCGTGGTLAFFKNKNFQVYGCDLGDEYLNYGKTVHGLELYNGDAKQFFETLKEKNIKIDLLIYEQVLEHVSDPVSELESIKSYLKDDVLLYIGVPGLRNIHNQYESNFLRYLQIPHLIHFDLASLTAILDRSGYELVHGNEKVHALFSPSKVCKKLLPLRPDQTLSYLHSIENIWRKRWIMTLPNRLWIFFIGLIRNRARKIPAFMFLVKLIRAR